jgi:hypothetical protein
MRTSVHRADLEAERECHQLEAGDAAGDAAAFRVA